MNGIPENVIQIIKELQLSNEKSLLKRLFGKNKNDKLNYYSTINEIIVGHKLKEKGFAVEYEKNFNGLKPDWYIEKDSKQFIVDVKSLFITKKDFKKHEFQNKLITSIESIKRNIYVRIKFEKEYFEFNKIDIEQNKIEFEKWLYDNCQVNRVFSHNEIKIEVTKTISNFSHVCVILHGGNIDIDVRRIFAYDTIDKSKKYQSIIKNLRIPFILAIFNEPVNGLDNEDVRKLLYGPCIFHETFNTEYSEMSGLFYSGDYKELITGIYWIDTRESNLQYFHNYYHDRELLKLLD